MTTVLNLRGHPVPLEGKRRVAEGALLGPNLWLPAGKLRETLEALRS